MVTLEQPESGFGSRFVVELPLTLSLTRCLMISGGQSTYFGSQRYAFPLNEVGEVRRVTQEDLRQVEGRESVRINNEILPLHDFSYMMGLQPVHQNIEQKHLLVVGRGAERRALLVDEVLDEQDVVARTFDSRLGKLRDMQGVTLLRDGGVALIVDLGDLLQSMQDSQGGGLSMGNHLGHGHEVESSIEEMDSDTDTGHILVVEDSATVREVERHMLEQAGYSVTTAVNGVDGFNKLRADNFDLIISDIDMPRMNGIEMITKIRATDKYGLIPIIVVSYKDREQDRMQALDAGANHYVTKAAFDSGEMMDRIRELIGVTL
jgi:two-component system sensor histidine kinase and response regulator WspE